MESYLYNAYNSYYNKLKSYGYIKDNTVYSLLIMTFIYRLVYFDYRGKINEDDYNIIEKAINCLYGRNCLLPYRDYLKMGKLHIGEYTEIMHKLCTLDTAFLENRVTEVEDKVDNIESTKVIKSKQDVIEVDDIQL